MAQAPHARPPRSQEDLRRAARSSPSPSVCQVWELSVEMSWGGGHRHARGGQPAAREFLLPWASAA
jgi:hypothetical protein